MIVIYVILFFVAWFFMPLLVGVAINVLDALFFPKKEGKEDTDGKE